LIDLPRKAAAISERRGRRALELFMKKLDTNSDMYRIVGCALRVYNTLKSGYLESVYEKALEWELLEAGFSVKRQVRIPVFYKGIELGKDFIADMVVDGNVIVELKAVSNLSKAHEAQVESYLKSTGMTDGLLVNFGNLKRLEWRVFSP
jgi:GxxExxY protein